MIDTDLRARFQNCEASWGLALERTLETETSLLGFGLRAGEPVVLKVLRRHDDEWRSGEVLAAYQGRGAVRVLERVPGAMLMERLHPATRLVDVVVRDDDEATEILARVISEMRPREVPDEIPTVGAWGAGFERHLATGDARLPRSLVAEAHRVFSELARTQKGARLLHGDLHHDNVLLDDHRGWVAIDPKGIRGEIEYEIGAALRNPCAHPALFSDAARIRSRIDIFVRRLSLDRDRVTAWAFAQAVLAAIWLLEEGAAGEPLDAWVTLANMLHTMRP